MPSVLEGSVFPIQLEKVSVERDGQEILASCDLTIEVGKRLPLSEKVGQEKQPY